MVYCVSYNYNWLACSSMCSTIFLLDSIAVYEYDACIHKHKSVLVKTTAVNKPEKISNIELFQSVHNVKNLNIQHV